jgi:fructoselysine and glucoselysine-specific PTS system IIC component
MLLLQHTDQLFYLGLLIPIMSQKADQYAEEGAYKGVERMHLLAGFGLSFM